MIMGLGINRKCGDCVKNKGLFIVVLFALAFAVAFVLMTNTSSYPEEQKVISAQIRYFDGSQETIILKKYWTSTDGVITLFTDQDRKVLISPNNVIIIEETNDQYNCMDGSEVN